MSNIGVLGTGSVGNTIGTKLVELGHNVMMGSRSIDNEKAIAFVDSHKGKAKNGTFADAAAFGDIIFNCTKGEVSLDALRLCGADNLRGKVLIDVSNPLDFSKGMPPSLNPVNTSSMAELIQSEFPETRVVKALNTMWCGIMVNPALVGGGDHHTFISGNDDASKKIVKELLITFGWFENNIIDLGDITTARGTEMYLPLWLRIYGATKSGAFNIRIVT